MRFKNLFNLGIGTLKANLFRINTPLNVMISLTDRCCSKCKYCNIPNRKKTELTTKEVIDLLNDAAKLGCQRVSLWGGEPLMREDIGQIINHIKNKKMHVNIVTNGYLVPMKINAIKSLDVIVISLDGTKEVHDQNREEGSYDKAIEAIKVAKEIGLKVWTITTLTKFSNEAAIYHVLDLSKKYNFLTTFQVMHHSDSLAGETQDMYATNEKYRGLIMKLISEKKKGAPIVTSLKFLKHLLKWEDYSINYSSKKIRWTKCFGGRLFCNIDTDGKVYPCVSKIAACDGKSIRETSFKKAFEYASGYTRINKCNSCIASGTMDFNFIHSFNLGVVLNWLKFS